jgi:hypothetical protein
MNVLETEWWTLALPPEWWAEAEEESILVGDRDGVGCIEITTLLREQGGFSPEEIRKMVEEAAAGEHDWQRASLGDFTGLVSAYVEEDAAVREWYVARGPMLLFVTYSCDLEHRGLDDAAVDELLDTLQVLAR